MQYISYKTLKKKRIEDVFEIDLKKGLILLLLGVVNLTAVYLLKKQ
jgi:hypothetical protein